MRYRLIVLVSIVLFPLFVSGQDLPDIVVKRERTYTGAGLYGFMNGGADLYLEYGVKSLIAREIVYKGEEFSIEIYEMQSPVDAFGIYSLHTFKCDRIDALDCLNCLSAYQQQLVVGAKYISIVFPSGSGVAKKAADELAQSFLNIYTSEKLDIPAILNLTPPYSDKLKYMRGPIAITNAQWKLSKVVADISHKGIWLVVDKQTNQDKALVLLSSKNDVDRIKERLDRLDIIDNGDDYIYITIER